MRIAELYLQHAEECYCCVSSQQCSRDNPVVTADKILDTIDSHCTRAGMCQGEVASSGAAVGFLWNTDFWLPAQAVVLSQQSPTTEQKQGPSISRFEARHTKKASLMLH